MMRSPLAHELSTFPSSVMIRRRRFRAPIDQALRRPDGLLAVGGDLSRRGCSTPMRTASSRGSRPGSRSCGGRPIRASPFDTAGFRLPSRLRRQLRSSNVDTARRYRLRCGGSAVRTCAPARPGRHLDHSRPCCRAYGALHALGHAHSDRGLRGGSAGGRHLRCRHRPDVLWREHVQWPQRRPRRWRWRRWRPSCTSTIAR